MIDLHVRTDDVEPLRIRARGKYGHENLIPKMCRVVNEEIGINVEMVADVNNWRGYICTFKRESDMLMFQLKYVQ